MAEQFTPSSLEHLPNPPRFSLRACTVRDVRHCLRILRDADIVNHSSEAVRAEVLKGLEAAWSPSLFAALRPRFEEYWAAIDDHQQRKRSEPSHVLAYSPMDKAANDRLINGLKRSCAPLSRMIDEMREHQRMAPLAAIAAAVQSWSDLDVPVVKQVVI